MMTWTWTHQAVRAAPACPDTPPAALELKLTHANTAFPQRWPPWRKKVSGEQRSVLAQQPAVEALAPPGLMQAVKLEWKMKGGKRKVRGFLYANFCTFGHF